MRGVHSCVRLARCGRSGSEEKAGVFSTVPTFAIYCTATMAAEVGSRRDLTGEIFFACWNGDVDDL